MEKAEVPPQQQSPQYQEHQHNMQIQPAPPHDYNMASPPPQQQQQHQDSAHGQTQDPSGRDHSSKEWQVGLFDCFGDCGASLIACCLPCILHGRTMERMRNPADKSPDGMNGECIVWAAIQCFTGCGCLYNMIKRTDIRETYGIQGSGCGDYCTSYWCLCCALVQQDREVSLRTGRYAPDVQGYQGEKQGMHMPSNVAAQQHQQPSSPQPPMQTGVQNSHE